MNQVKPFPGVNLGPRSVSKPWGVLQPEINQDTEKPWITMVSQGRDLQMVDLFFHMYGGVLEDIYIYICICIYYKYKLYYIIFYYIILYYITLYYSLIYYITLYCVLLYFILLYYIVLY
jgi:hypothetical protein